MRISALFIHCFVTFQVRFCEKWHHNAANEYKTPALCLLFSWVTRTWFIFRLISCNSMNRIMMLVRLWVPSLMITTSFHLSLRSRCFWRKLHGTVSFSCFPSAASSVVLQNAATLFWLWSSRNVLWTTKHPLTSHQHGDWVDADLYSYFLGELLLEHTYGDHVNLRTFSLSEERTCWRVFKELPERIIVWAHSGNRKSDPDAFSCSRLEYLSVLMSETCLKKYS